VKVGLPIASFARSVDAAVGSTLARIVETGDAIGVDSRWVMVAAWIARASLPDHSLPTGCSLP